MIVEDKLRGMFVGLAVGDALGAAVEFMPRGSFEPVDRYRAGGPHNLKAGYWTDDTSMALCSAASLIQCNKHDAQDQMRRYCRWYRDGYMSSTRRCFDIGNQTRRAIERFERDGANSLISKHSEDAGSAGNGALMRLAPMVIRYHADLDLAVKVAAENAALTHTDQRCLDANKAFTFLLIRALHITDKAELLNPDAIAAHFLGDLGDEIGCVLDGTYFDLTESQVKSTGYVVSSLEAALWAFYNSSSFAEGAKLAVNLGGDSDTIGAIYGQIAGAFWGYDAIPHDWVKELHDYERIVAYADLLATGITDYHVDTLISKLDISLPPTIAEMMHNEAIDTGIANYHSWHDLKDMPARHEAVSLQLSFKDHEMAAIKRGWIPEEMGEKMFMYYENDRLHMHRSWTGDSEFIVTFSDNTTESVQVNTGLYQPSDNFAEFAIREIENWIHALIYKHMNPNNDNG